MNASGLLVCLFSISVLAAPAAKTSAVTVNASATTLFQPLPEVVNNPKNPITEDKIKLGRMLYFENRMSKNQEISCNTCHNLKTFGVDNEPTSPGHKKQRGERNSPTTLNAAGHFVQFWDGRAQDVEAQAKGPILNAVEMAMPDEAYVLKVLQSIPGYAPLFKAAFPQDANPINYNNMANAIGAFERKLMTPSRFDKFLKGDANALTDPEKEGLNLFIETGCQACHMGAYVGGMMYQKFGLVKPIPNLKDKGRGAFTKVAAEEYFFKVPGLRNIEKTAPYFHDGSAKTLEEAVKIMAAHQLGKDLNDAQIKSIVMFLKSLTGELPKGYGEKPVLPKSGPTTPKPDPA